MSKPKIDRNKKILYLRDTEKMTFSEIATFVTLTDERVSAEYVGRIYRRETAKIAKQQLEANV